VPRLILGSYLVQFPLGGYMSWILQWLVGLRRLGHDVVFVEKAGGAGSCYDPIANAMGDDCSHGVRAVDDLLRRFELEHCWCFVDSAGRYHGLSRTQIEREFREADVFVDMGTHGAWLGEAADAELRVLIDGEPAATQMKMQARVDSGRELPAYDRYYTVGQNIGSPTSSIPTAGKDWGHVFYPVVCDLFAVRPPRLHAPFTTVMSWSAHDPVEYDGRVYGAKDVEFEKFFELAKLSATPIELAVAGRSVPGKRLVDAGFRLRDAHDVSLTYDAFSDYLSGSLGEFSVAKNVFVETNSGWFGDRAAAYLASGRPVVMQETGFSAHLPCGEGLFAVTTVEDAAAALDEISSNPERHSAAALEIAREHLDADHVLGRFLDELGVGS
jgi:hypothetical protein